MNESGFRSYFREHTQGFTLLEPLTTYEDRTVAREVTEQLLQREPDLAGLYISAGGITGTMAAIRDRGREDLVVVGYERIEPTLNGPLDGTVTVVIAHPSSASRPNAWQRCGTAPRTQAEGRTSG